MKYRLIKTIKQIDRMEKDNAFLRGYLCAVCVMLKKEGMATTPIRELFHEGTKWDLKAWRKAGIDEFDIDTLKQYKNQLV